MNEKVMNIIPLFNDTGEEGAEFYCLAYAPVWYHQTKKPALPSALGIYFCSHKDFTQYSQHSFAEDGHRLSYSRGDDKRDTLEFVFLSVLLESSVHPAMWRLFPRAKIPHSFQSDKYEQARRQLCCLLFHFRSQEMVARLLPHQPLMTCDESARRVAFGDFTEEDKELEQAIIEEDN
jgi:hypothetical protein